MDLIEKAIEKKGFINKSDYQMILFQIEHDKENMKKYSNKMYYDKKLTVTPISKTSMNHYKDQKERIEKGYHHIWTDCKHNVSEKGDYFAYIINPTESLKEGYIVIYEILEILDPKYSLKYWNNSERNVLLLSHKSLYEGNASELYRFLEYKDKYRQQSTMRISDKHQKKLNKYYASIFI